MIKRLLLTLAAILFVSAAATAQISAIEEDDFEDGPDMVVAPDFTLKDLGGNPVSLNEFQGNWVVLDFWGAWCKWCIKGIPEMKAAYAKYKDLGFEIIGIDCGDTPETWKEAVKRYELPWVNVYNPENSKLTEEYAIQGFPTKILVNPEGYIYEIFIGEDPQFYEYLDSIMSF